MKSNHHYNSTRNVVYARNGMVATSQPLAAQAGLDILKQGGNAVDAAIAVAACLTVVEPTSNGIGGDNFAIVSFKGQLYGLNSSGFAPKDISIQKLKDSGFTEIPKFGFVPVTVPGAVAGWVELSKEFGKLPLLDVLKPAIFYARNGFAVSPTVAYYWKSANQIYQKHLKGEMFKSWFDTFTKDLHVPEAGDFWHLKDHANTLEEIGKTEGKSFYQGSLANQIDAYSKKYGGYLKKSDLIAFQPEWVTPVSINYKGYDIWELPPNGQGIVALEALNIVENFKIEAKEKVNTYHQQIESLKLAFADGLAYISDLSSMKTSVDTLISKSYAKLRFKEIEDYAKVYTEGKPSSSGTVYLATADCDGNMVSMIQSNYMGFGSGLVVPNTGIALHNRGHNFSLDENSDNVLASGKRPFHTIIPGFISKDNTHLGPFGVMGGFMQPQGHMQVIMNMIDFKLDPQQALDAPRWQWTEGKKILVEPDLPKRIIKGLMDKGHDIQIEPNLGSFGRGQIIIKNTKTGVYCGGTEKRADGSIASY